MKNTHSSQVYLANVLYGLASSNWRLFILSTHRKISTEDRHSIRWLYFNTPSHASQGSPAIGGGVGQFLCGVFLIAFKCERFKLVNVEPGFLRLFFSFLSFLFLRNCETFLFVVMFDIGATEAAFFFLGNGFRKLIAINSLLALLTLSCMDKNMLGQELRFRIY